MTTDYAVFGLTVASDIELPGLDRAGGSPVDVRIRRGMVPAADARPGYRVTTGGATLNVPGTGRFAILDGREIVVDAEPTAPDHDVRLFILGSAMGALLHQRAVFPLHANAIVVEGATVAFMGPSGAGKSTLAQWFLRHGHTLLSDDVCAVTQDGAGFTVMPGIPRVRLTREALANAGLEADGLRLSYAGHDKFDVPLASGRPAPRPLPLAAAYVLSRSDGGPSQIIELKGMNAVEALIGNIYRGSYVRHAGLRERVLHAGVAMARAIPVFAVSRAWGFDNFDAEARVLAGHAATVIGERHG